MPKTTPPPASTPPAGSRRQQLAAQQAQAAREQRIRRRVTIILVATVAATLIGVLVWVGVLAQTPKPGTPTPGTVTANAAAAGSDAWTITVGQTGAPVRVSVYQDYMCPFCGRFDATNGDELNRLVAEGTIQLEIHPMSFLDRASNGTRYSTRAANAFVTAAKADPDSAMAFNDALFANQPTEGGNGLTDDQIATLATAAGVDPTVVAGFKQQANTSWVDQGTKADFASGITGTPTVLIDGKPFKGDLYSVGPLTTAIKAAAND